MHFENLNIKENKIKKKIKKLKRERKSTKITLRY